MCFKIRLRWFVRAPWIRLRRIRGGSAGYFQYLECLDSNGKERSDTWKTGHESRLPIRFLGARRARLDDGENPVERARSSFDGVLG